MFFSFVFSQFLQTRVLAIGGGSEEIMLDLTARMAKL